jgi:hypothetical protein
MNFCARCAKACSMRCTKCRNVYYCSTSCQKVDYPRHRITCKASKPKQIDIREIAKIVWEQFMNIEISGILVSKFHGKYETDEKCIWLMDEFQENIIKGSMKTWYCSQDKIEHVCMTAPEFFEFSSLGCCDVLTYSFCSAVFSLLQNKQIQLLYEKQIVEQVQLWRLKPLIPYKLNAKCWAKHRLPSHIHTDVCCDFYTKHMHTAAIFQTNISAYVIDLTAFQYGIQSTFKDIPCFIEPLDCTTHTNNFRLLSQDFFYSFDYWLSSTLPNSQTNSDVVTRRLCRALFACVKSLV